MPARLFLTFRSICKKRVWRNTIVKHDVPVSVAGAADNTAAESSCSCVNRASNVDRNYTVNMSSTSMRKCWQVTRNKDMYMYLVGD